jgi:hypothetical protein
VFTLTGFLGGVVWLKRRNRSPAVRSANRPRVKTSRIRLAGHRVRRRRRVAGGGRLFLAQPRGPEVRGAGVRRGRGAVERGQGRRRAGHRGSPPAGRRRWPRLVGAGVARDHAGAAPAPAARVVRARARTGRPGRGRGPAGGPGPAPRAGAPRPTKRLRQRWRGHERQPERWALLDADGLLLAGKPREAEQASSPARPFPPIPNRSASRAWRSCRRRATRTPPGRSSSAPTSLDPRNPDIRSFRAQLLEAAGRGPEARVEYVAAHVAEPGNPLLRDQLAEFYARQGSFDLALRTWRDAADATPDGFHRTQAGVLEPRDRPRFRGWSHEPDRAGGPAGPAGPPGERGPGGPLPRHEPPGGAPGLEPARAGAAGGGLAAGARVAADRGRDQRPAAPVRGPARHRGARPGPRAGPEDRVVGAPEPGAAARCPGPPGPPPRTATSSSPSSSGSPRPAGRGAQAALAPETEALVRSPRAFAAACLAAGWREAALVLARPRRRDRARPPSGSRTASSSASATTGAQPPALAYLERCRPATPAPGPGRRRARARLRSDGEGARPAGASRDRRFRGWISRAAWLLALARLESGRAADARSVVDQPTAPRPERHRDGNPGPGGAGGGEDQRHGPPVPVHRAGLGRGPGLARASRPGREGLQVGASPDDGAPGGAPRCPGDPRQPAQDLGGGGRADEAHRSRCGSRGSLVAAAAWVWLRGPGLGGVRGGSAAGAGGLAPVRVAGRALEMGGGKPGPRAGPAAGAGCWHAGRRDWPSPGWRWTWRCMLAAAWTAFLWAWLSTRLEPGCRSRARRLLLLPLAGVPLAGPGWRGAGVVVPPVRSVDGRAVVRPGRALGHPRRHAPAGAGSADLGRCLLRGAQGPAGAADRGHRGGVPADRRPPGVLVEPARTGGRWRGWPTRCGCSSSAPRR